MQKRRLLTSGRERLAALLLVSTVLREKLRPLLTSSWAGLAAIVLVSTVLRAWAAWNVPAPWFAGDEVIYQQLGQALWHDGELRILGAPTAFLSLVYPAVAGLPVALWNVQTGYRVLLVIQPLLMSLTAVPAYLWARSLGAGRWALAAAALTVAIPSLGYSSFVMTEVAFYPVAALAAWALAAAIQRPTQRQQGLLVGAIALAALTRLQALVLVPVLLSAIVVDAALARDLRRVRRFTSTMVGLGVLAFAWIAWQAASQGLFTGLLGAYGHGSGQAGYDPGALWRFVLYHAGALMLLVAAAPACAVASLFADAVLGREADDGVRAYAAVAVSLTAWLVLQVGLFSSENGERLEERYLIALAPVMFVGLAVWLARGGPRPVFRTDCIAMGAAALVAVLPLGTLIVPSTLGDSFTNLALWRAVAPGSFATVATIAAALAVALWALLPRRLLVVLPLVLLAGFAAASVSSTREAIAQAQSQQDRVLGPSPRWIDRAADGPVAFLYDGDPYWTAVWENLFFNHRLSRVIDLPATTVPGPLAQRVARPAPDGHVNGLQRYVVAWDSYAFDGTRVARAPVDNPSHAALVLWRLRTPRLVARRTGLAGDDTVTDARASLTVYGCPPGEAQIAFSSTNGAAVKLTRNHVLVRTVWLYPHGHWRGAVPSPAGVHGHGVCEFGLTTTGQLHVSHWAYGPVESTRLLTAVVRPR